MRIEKAASADRGFPSLLAQLVDSVATNRFGSSLLGLMRSLWGIKLVAVYSFQPHCGDTRLLLGAGDVPAKLVDTNSKAYVGHYAARDPARCAVVALARRPDAIATCVDRQELPERGHRILLEESDVRDRFACFFPAPDEHWVSLHAMRSSAFGAITSREFEEMRDFSALFRVVLNRHLARSYGTIDSLERLRRGLRRIGPELSCRELEVCALLLSGRNSAAIACKIGVGIGSIHTYRKRAYVKLGVGDMREIFTRLLVPEIS